MTEQAIPALPTDDEIRNLLAERVDACRLSVGISVGITDRGQRRLISHGHCDRVRRKPVSADTLFEIGSVTKLLTVLLLADMAQRGEVSLDDPVSKYLPPHVSLPERDGHTIKLLHLACHTSGLPRIPRDLDVHSANPYADYTAEKLYAFLGSCDLVRPSGVVAEYSNLGMGLLGHALAQSAGTEYETLVKARICGALGMNATSIALSPEAAEALATGHGDSLDPVPNWDLAVLAGAGGYRSNVRDLLTFLEALGAARSPLTEAIGIFKGSIETGGLGRLEDTPDGHSLISHEGHTGGYNAYVGYIPEWDRGVVVLANAYPCAASDLGRHLLDPRRGDRWFRREVDLDPNQFDRLVGSYRLTPSFILTVTREGDRLFVQATNQKRMRVFAAAEWHYFYKVVGAQITFEPGPDGRAARLILHQNSRDRIAVRVE
jgi:D-alanyl-D-alanine-carboxypeptidase/D-alanyl-D-alanine-endopeptidase